MTGIIITGHGHFASGVFSALEMVLGELTDILTVDFSSGDTKTELEENIKNAFEKFSHMDGIIVFCDLLSGSPFNTAIVEAMQRGENIRVFYGSNLGMILETTLNRNMGHGFLELVSAAQTLGRDSLGLFDANKVNDEDDGF